MKVIDINTKEVIDEICPDLDSNYYTTKKAWQEYKDAIQKYQEEFNKEFEKLLLYGETKVGSGVMNQMKEENISYYRGITEEEIDECFKKLAEEDEGKG